VRIEVDVKNCFGWEGPFILFRVDWWWQRERENLRGLL
jgi:hypothetical protein